MPLGQIDPHATIVITVGLDNSHPNTRTDSDPRIAISDGTNTNMVHIHDLGNYPGLAPCFLITGTHDNTLVSSGTKVPATFKLTFTPFYKYGSCETAQEGGYINTGLDSIHSWTSPSHSTSMWIGIKQMSSTTTIIFW